MGASWNSGAAGSGRQPWLLQSLSALVVALACFIYFGDRSQYSREISAQDFGGEWPWPTASKGMLQCHLVKDRLGNERPFIQIVLNGSVYALNSPALEASGWPDSRQLMPNDGQGPIQAEGRREVIQLGRTICGLPRTS